MNRSSTKSEKGESSKTPMTEPLTPTIPSPINSLEVPKHWFENHTAFGRWNDTVKHRSLSYVDILNYNFFLFEDLILSLPLSNQLPVSCWILALLLTTFL